MSIETEVHEGLARIASSLPEFRIDPAPIVLAGRRRHTRLIATSIGALGLAVVLLAASIVLPHRLGGAPPVSAAEALRQLATVSAEQDGLVPGPGQYTFDHVIERFSGSGGFFFDETLNYSIDLKYDWYEWADASYSGRTLISGVTVTFPTPADQAAWVAAGRPDLTFGEDNNACHGGLNPTVRLSEVPSDAAGVLDLLKAYGWRERPNSGPEMLGALSELLRENGAAFNLSPERRAAIFAAVSQIEGVSFIPDATDAMGRQGYGFRWSIESGYFHELIFDPTTGEFLAELYGSPPGDTTGEWDVAQVGVTDSVTSTPDGGSIPWTEPTPRCHAPAM